MITSALPRGNCLSRSPSILTNAHLFNGIAAGSASALGYWQHYVLSQGSLVVTVTGHYSGHPFLYNPQVHGGSGFF